MNPVFRNKVFRKRETKHTRKTINNKNLRFIFYLRLCYSTKNKEQNKKNCFCKARNDPNIKFQLSSCRKKKQSEQKNYLLEMLIDCINFKASRAVVLSSSTFSATEFEMGDSESWKAGFDFSIHSNVFRVAVFPGDIMRAEVFFSGDVLVFSWLSNVF